MTLFCIFSKRAIYLRVIQFLYNTSFFSNFFSPFYLVAKLSTQMERLNWTFYYSIASKIDVFELFPSNSKIKSYTKTNIFTLNILLINYILFRLPRWYYLCFFNFFQALILIRVTMKRINFRSNLIEVSKKKLYQALSIHLAFISINYMYFFCLR